MSKKKDVDLLRDIKEAIRRIVLYTENKSYDQFMADFKTQDAVVRNLEIIGEAAKNLSKNFRSDYDSIPWRDMARVRDRLIHHYSGVNFDIVWGVIKNDLPGVFKEIEDILERG